MTIPSTPHVAEIVFERSDALYEAEAVPPGQPSRRTVTVDLPVGPWLSIVYSGLRDQDGRFIAYHDTTTDDWYLDPAFGDDEYPWSDLTIAIVPKETQP